MPQDQRKLLVPSVPMTLSPEGTLTPDIGAGGLAEIFEVDQVVGVVRSFQASRTPSLDGSLDASPNTRRRRGRHDSGHSTAEEPGPSQPKRHSRRSLPHDDYDLEYFVNDSASEFEDTDDEDEVLRARELLRDEPDEQEASAEIDEARHIETLAEPPLDLGEHATIPNKHNVGDGDKPSPAVVNVFSWSEDYTSFTGHEETFTPTPGPTINESDPTAIFMLIWDLSIMSTIVRETNRYAQQYLEACAEKAGGLSRTVMRWVELSVEELYVYFALIILMSIDYRSSLTDYWTTDILEMPKFRAIMSRNRYFEISRFLHFVNNIDIPNNLSSHEKKLHKVQCIVDHCNRKFQELYIPQRELSLDESLLLWKGRLSWIQCIRTKAARFGIKSYELCEAATFYLLKVSFYTGKASDSVAEAIAGFTNVTAKVVLKLAAKYLDKGYCLFMDNWYNQLALTRYLKAERKTDVVGTLNRNQQNVPEDVKALDDKRMVRGTVVSRHCGDISVEAWKDVKLVTTLSTYHKPEMVPGTRGGVPLEKPLVIRDYNKSMGGVDQKDQMLSMFLMERKRGTKWYIKVFKRMLNSSLLNTFIIYKATPGNPTLSHREIRMNIAKGLLARFPFIRSHTVAKPTLPTERRLDRRFRHIPDHTIPNTQGIRPRKRCKNCWERCQVRRQVTTICKDCDVGLCLGSCWENYHYNAKL